MVHQQKMNRRYFFLALVPIVLSVILALLPDKSSTLDANRIAKNLKSAKYTGVSPDKLLLESVKNDRFMQPDDLGKIIMGQDPSYMLIDLREPKDFEKFALPGAINIPAAEILKEDNIGMFDSDAYTYVLISNGSVLSEKVWTILRRAGYDNLKVLDGGMNQFLKLFFEPPMPGQLDPSEAFDNYDFRKAVGAHLGFNGTPSTEAPAENVVSEAPKAAPKKVVTPAKAKGGDEGC